MQQYLVVVVVVVVVVGSVGEERKHLSPWLIKLGTAVRTVQTMIWCNELHYPLLLGITTTITTTTTTTTTTYYYCLLLLYYYHCDYDYTARFLPIPIFEGLNPTFLRNGIKFSWLILCLYQLEREPEEIL